MRELGRPLLDDRMHETFVQHGFADFSHTVECKGSNWIFRARVMSESGVLCLIAHQR